MEWVDNGILKWIFQADFKKREGRRLHRNRRGLDSDNNGGRSVSEQLWSGHIVIVRLPSDPHTSDELDRVIQLVTRESAFDIIMDFSDVLTIQQRAICQLMILQRILHKSARHLGFYNLNPQLRKALIKHRIGRFLRSDFDKNIDLVPLPNATQGGALILGDQQDIETLERRRYIRYNLSKSLEITALLWHDRLRVSRMDEIPLQCVSCILSDVSEGGVQVVMEAGQEITFSKGQSVHIRFAPFVGETPVTYRAVVKGIFPTADDQHICLGVEFVGLEENLAGRLALQQLCASQGRYFEATVCPDHESIETM